MINRSYIRLICLLSGGVPLFFSGFLLLFCVESQAQISSCSKISYEDLSVSGVLLGSVKATFTEKFGVPDTIVTKTNEFEGTLYDEYVYGKSVFFVSADKFEGFEIRDRPYYLDGTGVQIGDSLKNLERQFPVSFQNRNGQEESIVVKVQIGDTDSYVLFKCINHVIKEISTWDDL